MTYKRASVNIQTGDASWVEKHRELFFGGSPTARDLAEQLAGEARLLGSCDVEVSHHGNWCVVGSSRDWCLASARYRPRLPDLFNRVVAFPEAGDNCIRTEVLLTAFATDVVTMGEDGELCIKGSAADPLLRQIFQDKAWSRLVAFKIPGAA